MSYSAIVIGASAGGIEALKTILFKIPHDFSLPIIIVQHIKADKTIRTVDCFKRYCNLKMFEAESNMPIQNGCVYFAPPDYHILIEKDRTISISVEEKVNYSRPSIDVLFETAAYAYGSELIGIILTGASPDGSKGLLEIKKMGGLCIIQDPQTAFSPVMPREALKLVDTKYVLTLEDISDTIINYKKLGG